MTDDREADRRSRDRASLSVFAARGIGPEDAERLLGAAQVALRPDVLATALETFEQSRVLSWSECMTLAELLAPEQA